MFILKMKEGATSQGTQDERVRFSPRTPRRNAALPIP